MALGDIVKYVFISLFALGMLYLFFRLMNSRLLDPSFGAPVARTLGKVVLARTVMLGRTITVHRLIPRDLAAPEVGFAIRERWFGDSTVRTFGMTRSQARALADLLSRAVAASR